MLALSNFCSVRFISKDFSLVRANKLNYIFPAAAKNFGNVPTDRRSVHQYPSCRVDGEKVRSTESLDFNRRPDRKEARPRNCSRIGLRARRLFVDLLQQGSRLRSCRQCQIILDGHVGQREWPVLTICSRELAWPVALAY